LPIGQYAQEVAAVLVRPSEVFRQYREPCSAGSCKDQRIDGVRADRVGQPDFGGRAGMPVLQRPYRHAGAGSPALQIELLECFGIVRHPACCQKPGARVDPHRNASERSLDTTRDRRPFGNDRQVGRAADRSAWMIDPVDAKLYEGILSAEIG
jgi:hypothetical protein